MTRSKRLLSFLLVIALVAGVGAAAAAKVVTEPIDAPDGEALVFNVSVGDKNVNYTWDDMAGTGRFDVVTLAYGDKDDDGNQAPKSWTGVLLSDILDDVQEKTGVALEDDYRIKTVAADGYMVALTVEDALDPYNRYIVACDPVSNYDDDGTYDDSYVRIMRGQEDEFPNATTIRCVLGIEILDAMGDELDTVTAKTQGGDMANSIFYIAVKESADSPLKLYYYTLAELQAYDAFQDFTYDDHSIEKTVTARGVHLKTLLDSITDAEITDDMVIQYAEEDGFHAEQSASIQEASYKDKYAWLDQPHQGAGGETCEATNTMITYGINEKYIKPDERTPDDPAGVYKWAELDSNYLRAYRNRPSASSVVVKTLMGVVVSYNGQLFSGKDGYSLTAMSSKNQGTPIKAYDAVKGLLPGMKFAVKAPAVTNATLAGGQDTYKEIIVGQGTNQAVQFLYDERPFFTVDIDGAKTSYVYTDFLISEYSGQVPSAQEGESFMSSRGGIGYGYANSMLFRYYGIWLKDLIGDVDLAETLQILTDDGDSVAIDAADLDDYFVAYGSSRSKGPKNTAENKRITEISELPFIIKPGGAKLVCVVDDDTGVVLDQEGPDVILVAEDAVGIKGAGGEPKAEFTDLDGFQWAFEAIGYLAENEIIEGVGDNRFAPGDNILRGDFILMLHRAYDLDAETDGNFEDVPEGSYYYEAIAVAKALDIARGDGKLFNPRTCISRQDAMALIFRTLEAKGIQLTGQNDLSEFSDAAAISEDYALEPIQRLVEAGVINGMDGKINPFGNMRRADMAVALYRALMNIS